MAVPKELLDMLVPALQNAREADAGLSDGGVAGGISVRQGTESATRLHPGSSTPGNAQ